MPPTQPEWLAPEVIAQDVITDDFLVPLAITAFPSGVVVCWSAGSRESYDVWVAEKTGDQWKPTKVGTAATINPPRPAIACDVQGNLVVAWTVPWDAVGAACFVTRNASDGTWSAPRPIDKRCCGEIDLWAGSVEITAAYVREVKKFSAKKLAGDFVHDPVIQPYGKVALGTLVGTEWNERQVVEKGGLVEGERPRLNDTHVLFFREGLLGRVSPRVELAYVNAARPDQIESIAGDEELGTGSTDAAIAVDKDHPIVAFTGNGGILVRERGNEGWLPAVLAIGNEAADRPSLAAGGGRVCVVGVDRVSNEILLAERQQATWGKPQRVASGQTAVVSAFKGTRVLAWCEGLPAMGPRGWVGMKPSEYPRRILLLRQKRG